MPSQSTEEVETAGHRLAEHLHMLCKGELSVIFDNQRRREVIAEHSFSTNGDVGLPGRFCTYQAKEGFSHLDVFRVNLALSDQTTTLSIGCKGATIMFLLRALRAINRSSA